MTINKGTIDYLFEESMEIQRQKLNLNALIKQHRNNIWNAINSDINDVDNIIRLLNLLYKEDEETA
jgi:hypothetical protein